jgi:hypothetical protein
MERELGWKPGTLVLDSGIEPGVDVACGIRFANIFIWAGLLCLV